jgi:hypothetical protein
MTLKRTLAIVTGAAALGLVTAAAALAAGGPPPWAGQNQQAAAAGSLDAAEATALAFMREEEKLARDAYATLAKSYPSNPIFSRISEAEQTHMDAVGRLLTRYGIADPAAGKAPGVFEDAELQKLYNTLVAQGRMSPAAALEVGVTVERADIADLQRYLGEIDNADIERVFTNLLRGSQNHLQAFSSGSPQDCRCAGTSSGNGPRWG